MRSLCSPVPTRTARQAPRAGSSEAEGREEAEMKVRPMFAWYDFWIGVFYDRAKRRLYVFLVPMFGVVVEWGETTKGPR